MTLADDRVVVRRDATVRTGHGLAAVRVTKDLRAGGDRRSPTLSLAVTVESRSNETLEARLGVEWTLTMLGGGGNPAAWLEVGKHRAAHDTSGTATAVRAFGQGNSWIGIEILTTLSEPADLWWAPVETVSNSEAGFERVYQGAGLLPSWPLSLAAGETRTVTVTHAVTTTRDRVDDESADAGGDESAGATAAGATAAANGA